MTAQRTKYGVREGALGCKHARKRLRHYRLHVWGLHLRFMCQDAFVRNQINYLAYSFFVLAAL